MTRSVTERACWKANEFRNWVLFYSLPCLRNILSKKYYEHYALLVDSLHILLSEEINQRDLIKVKQKLKTFVEEFELLYHQINMTYNVHLTNHITECIENCGPIWVYSNFCFENNNGILSKYVKGTRDVIKQISSKYLFNKIVQLLSNDIPDNVSQYKLCLHKNKCPATEGGKFYGKSKDYAIDEKESLLFIENNILLRSLESYDRFSFESDIYCSQKYCSNTKYDNSVILLKDNTYAIIKNIFKYNNETLFYGNIYEITAQSEDYISKQCNKIKYLNNSSCSLQLFRLENINKICFHIKVKNGSYVSAFPNRIETD